MDQDRQFGLLQLCSVKGPVFFWSYGLDPQTLLLYILQRKKQLFSKLMRESPSFNRDNKDPDWKHAVQIWNHDHVDGKTIFYKVRPNTLI